MDKKEPPKHDCTKNYQGSSKGMEAFAGVNLVTKLWRHKYCCCISQICADDDSSIRAQMKHLIADKIEAGLIDKDDWPRGTPTANNRLGPKLRDTGKLPLDVKVIPTWVCDPNHRKKVFRKKCTVADHQQQR